MSFLSDGLRQGAPDGSSIGPPWAKPIGSTILLFGNGDEAVAIEVDWILKGATDVKIAQGIVGCSSFMNHS